MKARKAIRKGLVFGIVFVLVFVVFAGIPINVSAEEESNPEMIEILEKRNLWSKTYYKGNSEYVAEISTSPMHYYDELTNQYENIDTTITQYDENTYVNFNNILKSEFPTTTGNFVKISFGESDRSIEFRTIWMGYNGEQGFQNVNGIQSSNAEVVNNTINYPNIFSQVTEQYIILNGEVKRNFILDRLPETPIGVTYLSIATEYKIGDLDIYSEGNLKMNDFSTSGSVEFRNPLTNLTIFIIPEGIAFDSSGDYQIIKLSIMI
jgi:hypothetical protein